MVQAPHKSSITQVRKRDGSLARFHEQKIVEAIWAAMKKVGKGSHHEAEVIASRVRDELTKIGRRFKNFVPDIEGIQDAVEKELILADLVEVAKEYILYRQKRSEERSRRVVIPQGVKDLVQESQKYFANQLAEVVYYRTYSRWIPEKNRRESWVETVDRYMAFMKENLGSKLSIKEYREVREAILTQEALPSMRLLQFAGDAARKTNVCAYNCSFTAPTRLRDFSEIMYISMCGTGVGYSVESYNVEQLPQIALVGSKKPDRKPYVIADSREGWCDAFLYGLETWYAGGDVEFDYSLIRPAGARLKVMGGTASGPQPLIDIMNFARHKIQKRAGRRLTTLDVHDLVCKIGDIVVAGGVRRSAMISLSDLDDVEIRDCKKGEFWNVAPHRMMANNSAVYTEKPNQTEFLREWLALIESNSGERGIFNRSGLPGTMPQRRVDILGDRIKHVGTNPCGEILLQPRQFCNLTEIVARPEDTEKSLLKKMRIATILGTYQASLTNFGYLSKEWQKTCREEALLGVSITGQWDCPAVRNDRTLEKLRRESIKVNKAYAKKIGINPSSSITTAKPSGNASQTVDSSSGMHPRHAKYYIRRVRISRNDPLYQMLEAQGYPSNPEVGQTRENAHTMVLDFPVAAPRTAIVKDDLTALDQLEHWKMVKTNYTEHNPSVTVSVGTDEWIAVGNWVYENWDIVGGLSFLPRSEHVYQLAPYEEIDKKTYQEMVKKVKPIDFSQLVAYEREDHTENKKELACVSGSCEV